MASRPAPVSTPAQVSLPIRDDISFPKRSDADWDVPAYQRRSIG
jgi:hypothetical protein